MKDFYVYIHTVTAILGLAHLTGGQVLSTAEVMSGAFCGGAGQMLQANAFQTANYMIQTSGYPSWSMDDQCTCTVTAYDDPTGMTHNEASVIVKTYFPPDDSDNSDDDDDDDEECGPLLIVSYGSLRIARCPTDSSQNITEHTFHLLAGSSVNFALYNPAAENVKVAVLLTVNFGSVAVSCGNVNSVTLEEDLSCPCGATRQMPLLAGAGDDTSIKTRLGVAIAAVLVFVAIIALIGGVCWWRNKRANAKEEEETPSTGSVGAGADNRAYLSSKPNLASPAYEEGMKTPGGRNSVPFIPDPTLNLSLQDTPKNGSYYKGSTDSGLYSIPTDGNLAGIAGMPDLGAGQMYSNFGGFNAHGHQAAPQPSYQQEPSYQPEPQQPYYAEPQSPQSYQPPPQELYAQVNKPAQLPVEQTQADPPIKYTRPGYSGSQEGLDAHRSLNTSKASLNTVGSCISTDV